MLRYLPPFLLCGCMLLIQVPAAGQTEPEPEVDCHSTMNQLDLNFCSAEDYRQADAQLNAQWDATRAVMAKWDNELRGTHQGAGGETYAKALISR